MIQIDEIRLRLPQMEAQEGRQLGQTVAQQLGQELTSLNENRQIDELHIRIPARSDLSPSQLAEAITGQVLTKLDRR